MTNTVKAIKEFSQGFITVKEMVNIAKKEGFKLEREGNALHIFAKNGRCIAAQSL